MKLLEPIGWICLIAFCLHQLKVADVSQFAKDNWQRIAATEQPMPTAGARK
jgi:hypothetical protein